MSEITTTEQLQAYLVELGSIKISGTELDLNSLQLLTAGSANFVWRIFDRAGRSFIIKHAEPYVKSSPGLAFPVGRMDFEYNAMTCVPRLLDPTPLVSVADIFRYDSGNHVIMMEDSGPRNLKAAYADPALDVPGFGEALGRWLAGLHRQTKHEDIGDNKIAKAIYRFSYNHLAAALKQYDQDPSLAEQINTQYGSLLQTDDECVCHGDFWPGNVMITDQMKLKIVDWEMVRRGCGATDVGQFAAEAHLLDRFRGGRGLRAAFLKGYRATGDLDRRFVQRVAIHMGVHLAFWPTRVSWGTKEETKDMVEIGCRLMRQALGEDDSWLVGSLVSELQV